MGSPDPHFVIAEPDPRTRRDQIEAVIALAREKGEPIRVRLPLTLYGTPQRGYIALKDAAWNLQLPTEQTTPEAIERLIHTIGKCLVAIAQDGSEEVLRRLGQESAA